MHSAAGIEDRLFTPARIRLTAWYVSVLAAVLIVLGTALYLVVRQQLLNGVDNGVKLVAAKATEQWIADRRDPQRAQHRPLHGELPDDPRAVDRPQPQVDHLRKRSHLDKASMEAAYTSQRHRPALVRHARAIASVSTRCE